MTPSSTAAPTWIERRLGVRRDRLSVWPYTWASLAWFAAAFLALSALFTVVGWMVVNWFEPTSLGQAEAELNYWLEDERTPALNTVAQLASVPSNTLVKIGLVALLLIAFPLIWKRWHDWAFLFAALVLEVSVYGLSSWLVGRPRPDVERLSSAPTESFPFGHVAAAISFYVGLALVVGWHTERRSLRAAAWTLGLLIPVGMIASRLYLGMHYVTDIVGGVVLGTLALMIALWIARRGLSETVEETDGTVPEDLESFDLNET
jgi:undecaprenyl-diphosphatase